MRLATPTQRVVVALALMVWVVPEWAAQVTGPVGSASGLGFVSAQGGLAQAARDQAEKAKAPAKQEQPSAAPAESQTPALPPAGRRRDPFEPLIQSRGRGGQPDVTLGCTAPGKAGLVVSAVRLDGVVRTSNGMIAVVTNPQSRVYFLREADRLCNGSVERITLESVSFRERGKDAFGNPLDRVIVKRLYPSAGEER